MHQSSLGTLMLLPDRGCTRCGTPLVPLLFLLSCVAMGYAAVVFESAFSSVAFKRAPGAPRCWPGSAGVIAAARSVLVVALRLGDLAWRGQLGAAVRGRPPVS